MNPLRAFAERVPPGSRVLDVGCWNMSFKRKADAWGTHLEHAGVDRERPFPPQPDYDFALCDVGREPLPFPNETFDAVVLSHVIEHVSDAVALTREAFRVVKTGGLVYVETPSERSLWIPSMPFRFEASRSLSFYDDPTHIGRPQSPQSLYRLLSFFGAEIVELKRIVHRDVLLKSPWLLMRALLTKDAALLELTIWRAFGFAVYAVARSRGREGHYPLPS